MRNTLPLLARAVVPSQSNDSSYEIHTQTPPTHVLANPSIPAIRLTHATPSPDASLLPDSSFGSVLAPRDTSPRKKLVPKKSKLALLASRATSSGREREKDLSDVIRRVNTREPMSADDGTCNVTVNGGTMLGDPNNKKTKTKHKKKGEKTASSRSTIDIYVDPSDDPDIGEIVVVKKKKSRAKLEAIGWALSELTNEGNEGHPGDEPQEKKDDRLKLKVEEKERGWWSSIGRGRRDSKGKEKENATISSKFKLRAKAPSASAVPPKPASTMSSFPTQRPRNHSLDSGLLLSNATPAPTAPTQTQGIMSNPSASASTPFLSLSRFTADAKKEKEKAPSFTTALPAIAPLTLHSKKSSSLKSGPTSFNPGVAPLTLTKKKSSSLKASFTSSGSAIKPLTLTVPGQGNPQVTVTPSPVSDCFSADPRTQSHYSHSRGASPLPSPSLPPAYHAQSQTEYAAQAQAHYAESARSYNAESQRSYNTETQYAVSQRSQTQYAGSQRSQYTGAGSQRSQYIQPLPHPHPQPQTQSQRPRFGSTPGLLSPPDSGYADAFLNTANNGGYGSVRGRQNSESSAANGNGGNTGTINGNGKGSIALRAMKSLARIGSWAQLRNDGPSSTTHPAISISHPIPIPAVPSIPLSHTQPISSASLFAEPSKADLKKEQAKEKEREKEKKHNSRPAPSKRTISNPLMLTTSTNPSVEPYGKMSSSSFEVGALSSPGRSIMSVAVPGAGGAGVMGEDMTGNSRLPKSSSGTGRYGSMAALGHGPPPVSSASQLAAAQSSTLSANANSNRDKDRASSGSTTSLSVPVPNYARSTRLSGASAISSRSAYSNSSGEHTGVGSTYSASGEDNTHTNSQGFVGTTSKKGGKEDGKEGEKKKKSSVRWGGVSIGGLTVGSKRESKESKDSKESKEGGKSTKRKSGEGRKRTPVMSVFPGLAMRMGGGRGSSEGEREEPAVKPEVKVQPVQEPPQLQLQVREDEVKPRTQVRASIQSMQSDYDFDGDDLDFDVDEACVRYAVRMVPPSAAASLYSNSNRAGSLYSNGGYSSAAESNGGHGAAYAGPTFTAPTIRASSGTSVSISSNAAVNVHAPAQQAATTKPLPVPPAQESRENTDTFGDLPKMRQRPLSEQMLGTRRRGVSVATVGTVGTLGDDPIALSMLEAANYDLATLINRLDLEATPDSKASRPVSFAVTDPTTTSIFDPTGSLRGIFQAHTNANPASNQFNATLSALNNASTGTTTAAPTAFAVPPYPYSFPGPSLEDVREVDESPLKKIVNGRGTIKAKKTESVTSLRPYAVRSKTDPGVPTMLFPVPPVPTLKMEAPKATKMELPPLPPLPKALKVDTQVQQEKDGRETIRTTSATLRQRAAPFISRTPSVISTFGSTSSPSQSQTQPTAPAPPPVKYRLPSPLESSPGAMSIHSTQVDTPTKVRSHKRQASHLVPIRSVKAVVEGIERREKEMREREEVTTSSREVGSRKGSSSSSGREVKGSSSSKGSVRPEEREVKRSMMDARTRKALGFKGTMGVHDDDDEVEQPESPMFEEDEDSDIPDELRIVLSQSDREDNTRGSLRYSPDLDPDTLSFIPTASMLSTHRAALPPSPGLPPSAPLPTPSPPLQQKSRTMQPSPPAPSLLPMLEPTPSPSSQLSFLLTGPILPALPTLPPPAFKLTLPGPASISESGSEADNERVSPHTSDDDEENDTKGSFDFTGELARLNESGGANRQSFVEQLEEAFKTPAPVRTMPGLGEFLSVPPVPNGAGSVVVSEEGEGGVKAKASYGGLDRAFKFGGRPQEKQVRSEDEEGDDSLAQELPGVAALSTLDTPSPIGPSKGRNDLGLPHQRRRSLSTSAIEEDSSILRSIFAQAAEVPSTGRIAKLSLESDTSSKRRARMSSGMTSGSQVDARYSHARNASDVSFSGLSSFGAMRTKFEFGPNTSRPGFYSSIMREEFSHDRHESLFSIASISSYGELIHGGSNDPFNYGVEMDEEERDGLPALSSFDEARRRKRLSTDSDVSSFYFRSHRRNQSVVSTTSVNGPPISLYNRSHASHKRNDSSGSASSVAMAYANGGWLKQHRADRSIDSVMSDFSAARLGRPGVGDKMFESAADGPMPLSAISASPPESVVGSSNELAKVSSYDSILDEDRRSTVDSIFDRTGQRSSMSSDSVFGYDESSNRPQFNFTETSTNLFPPALAMFRPLSVISVTNHGSPREDDTMITMLGGEHVRRRSIGSSFEGSPCFRVEKRKHEVDELKLARRESTASNSSASAKSFKLFGERRMSLAKNGLLHRNSLEDSCLSAEGEDDLSTSLLNVSVRSNTFTRPLPSSRARNRPTVMISQPPDTTPPLSSAEDSQSGGSQSSIDIGRLKALLQTASAGQSTSSSRARARARGHGHRRRPSQMSRSSIIVDTIQEENPGLSHSPSPSADFGSNKRDSFDSVASVPQPEAEKDSQVEIVDWEDERLVLGLRKYCALRNEADETITQSRLVWPDTQFSLHALQTFEPPKHPAGMQALLEHSQKTYIALPADMRPRRMRSLNRPSPYPRHRPTSSTGSSTKSHSRPSSFDGSYDRSRALQTLHPNGNVVSPPPTLAITPFSPFAFDSANQSNDTDEPLSTIKPSVRPRVGSAARRNALGWTKRKTPKASSKTHEGKSFNANKENEAHGLLTSPPESLRIPDDFGYA
ncbi:hypothetical protein M422DRAFT_63159 [Sphaerobolus stellatus SS14]|nr:hypothetical protein M422DRAFT_63159 [Sphaerobolus stellatus SS14]